ncbi:MAG TPA: M61 family peptidase [Polyangia bacterium]|jgi:predicted metalloprotease with PDZ domain
MSRAIPRTLFALALTLFAGGLRAAAATPPAMTLTVDATDAARGVLHAHVVVPVAAGELVLAYPKWIPGEHRPTGPIADLVNLRITAGGKPVAWRRDSADLFELHVTVPSGASSLDVDLDALSRPGKGRTTASLVDLRWNEVVLYPKVARVASLAVRPRLRLPSGWSFATALTKTAAANGTIEFAPVSLETLVDSPVIAGAHLATFDLGTQNGAPHTLALVGDDAAALAVPAATVESWKRMVAEANALFGARHYGAYHFLVTASDFVSPIGLEHHASSEEPLGARELVDPDLKRIQPDYLAHEYAHSWDGKYRRPRGLATSNYQEPMRGDLLWVYEGLTEYLGWLIAVRSGMLSADDARAIVGRQADVVDVPGRAWRPLVDTAISTDILYGSGGNGGSMRRNADYYPEGFLIWLEADVLIRKQTNGARSLDDFCQRFFGGTNGPPEVRPYDLDDVVSALDATAPSSWRAFFEARVDRIAPVPLGGVEGAGYKIVFTDEKPELTKVRERVRHSTTYWRSLGFYIDEKRTIAGVLEGSPADRAGLTTGMTLVAVDAQKLSPDAMKAALARAKTQKAPIELLVESQERYRTFKLDWHGGERYRALARDPSQPDLLAKIMTPRLPRRDNGVARAAAAATPLAN